MIYAKSKPKTKLLYIEDESDILYLVSRLLEKEGFEVELARTGAEGMKKAKESKPDLILLDIMLPDIDGWEVCKKLKEEKETKDIPVVMLTVRTSDLSVEKSFAYAGADAHIGKPFEREELINAINRTMELGKHEKQ